MASPRYISEIHVPVKKDSLSFQDRHIQQWGDVENRMQERRKQWEDQFEKIRQDFFTLKPTEVTPQAKTSFNFDSGLRTMYESDSGGEQKFNVRFEVSEFQPEEIIVKLQENKLLVNAKHEEKNGQTSVSREYSRQVDIPSNVDQEKMECVLSKDGVLSVDAPLIKPQSPHKSAQEITEASGSGSGGSGNNNSSSSSNTCRSFSSSIKSSAPFRSLNVATAVKNPIVTEPDGTRKLRLVVDIGEFNPEDAVVKTNDRKLIVHAEHEEKSAGRTLHKEFNKEYDLPESVDPSTISAYIGEDRTLIVEAPLRPVQRKAYSVSQSQDVRKVTVSKESSMTIKDSQNHRSPVVTINLTSK